MRTIWLLGLLLLAPLAGAHGASPAREFETRLLNDTEGTVEYSGPENRFPVDGLDILTLDVFEATLPGTVEPALVFRVTVLGGTTGDHRIDLTAGDATLELATSDLATYTSTTFDLVRGPFDAGDGHAKTIEGWVRHATLGAAVGDAVTGITATSYFDEQPQDVAPGSWFLLGEQVPMPMDETPDAASYTLQGPADLFSAVSNTTLVTAGQETIVGLTFNSSLAATDQVLELVALAPAGINVSFSDTTVLLDAGSSAAVTLSVSGVALGSVRVLAQSDLGVSRLLALAIDGGGMIGPGVDVDSGPLATGESFQYTFTQPGTFDYHCHPHPWMMAKVGIVERPNGTAPTSHVVRFIEPASDSSTWKFEPADLTINTGDTVIWVNEGSTVHTIMGTTGGSGGHDGHDHDHDHPTPASKDSPGPLFLVSLAAALWLARRR